MPLVSIITCTYNRAHLIGETIESVLGQTFGDFEHIIIDESSEDNTEEVVGGFKDSRLKYYKIPNTNGHLSRLRNMGISKAQGKYIAFIDSDDLWHSDKLHLQVNKMESDASVDFSYTDIRVFNEDGIIRETIYNRAGTFTGSVFEDLVRNKFVICATTLLFRKSCILKVGHQNENLKSGDFDYIMSLATHFNAFAIWEAKVNVRKHEQNLTQILKTERAESYLAPLKNLFGKNLVSEKILKQSLSKLYYTFGVQFLHQKDHRFAASYLTKAIIYNPFSVKSFIRLAEALMKNIIRL
jgi:glycosyltransferase involved in cell wall biosynthesis